MSEIQSEKRSLPLWRRIALGMIILAIVGMVVLLLADSLIGMPLDKKIAAIHKAGYPVNYDQLGVLADTAMANDAEALYRSGLSRLPIVPTRARLITRHLNAGQEYVKTILAETSFLPETCSTTCWPVSLL